MKIISIIKYLFSFIGAAFLTGALLWFQHTRSFVAHAEHARGTVVELSESRSSDSTTYHPVVRFTTSNGSAIEFRSSSGSNPPSYQIGEQVPLLYETGNPHNASIDSFFSLWGGSLVLSILGGVFFLVGVSIMLFTTFKNRSDEFLKQHGTAIHADFQSIELNTALDVNGRNPFRIITQWQNPETSEVHIFKSNNIWFDPAKFVTSNKITVFVDKANLKKYVVDISFLPKLAGQ